MMNSSNTSAAMSKPTTFFQGFVILFCGVDEVIRKKAADFVVRNGGKCVDKFCTGVTCGIVGKVGSIGFKELVVAKVPLLTLKWLQDCSTSRSLAQMEGSMYKVGYATGLNVVCTQLTLEERTRVQQLVEKGGGTYSDRFVGMVCTHLIAKTPEGDKYMGAKKCGTVRIVTCSWVEECAKRKGAHFILVTPPCF